jgi:AraC family transcriptional regulator
LTHIQTHLAGDLSLDRLASVANLSPHHFHRQFRELIGETTKQYTQRLRLEKAAYQLKTWDAPILDIALDAGYHSHETFSRAFRRQFDTTPKSYRQREHIAQWLGQPPANSLNHFQEAYQLSKTAFHKIQSITVAFIRHLGPYVEADMTAFDRLIGWAQQKGLYTGDNLLIGIGHDDPNITPLNKVRFDACIEVAHPIAPEGEIGYQVIPSGYFAMTTYIGPYGRILEQAYSEIFQHVFTEHSHKYRLIGIPAIEIYRTTKINPTYSLNHTDIYLPVEKFNA